MYPPRYCHTAVVFIMYTLLDFLETKSKHKAAYRNVIQKHSTVNICPVRFNHVGLPRSGKTSFRRRLTGLILNLLRAKEAGEKVQHSTGVAEEGGQVIIRDMTTDIGTIQCKAWSLLKDLLEEANMLSQFFYQTASSADSSDNQTPACEPTQGDAATTEPSASIKRSKVQKFTSLLQKKLGKRKSKLSEANPSSDSSKAEDEDPSVASKVAEEEMKCFPSLEKPWKKTSGMLLSTFWKTSFC